MKIHVSRDEVLAWMAADPGNRGPAVASRHFGIKADTVRQWLKRARDEAGVTASRNGTVGTVHLLPPPPVSPLLVPPQKPVLPPSMQAVARRACRALIERIEHLAPTADPKEAAAMFAALTDRFDVIGNIKPQSRKSAADPGTEEGRKALLEELLALPPALLDEAVRARRGA